MGNYQEEKGDEKLYSREVLRLLFKYILRYRKYLFLSLFFVLFITGANLTVPYLLKLIIDRYIFKQGRTFFIDQFTPQKKNAFYLRKFNSGIKLSYNTYFLFQSQLRYFSGKEMEELIDAGVISRDEYILIESPSIDGRLKGKIKNFIGRGKIFKFENSLYSVYLFNTDIVSRFTVHEFLSLRTTDFTRIIHYVLIIVAILLIQFGASYIQIIFLMKLSQYAMKDLRKDLFSHLINLEISYFDKNPMGKLINRITNDIESLNELFSSVLVTLFQDILMMFGIAFVMFFTDLYLASVVAGTFPFIILFTILFRIKVRNAYRVIRTRITELNNFLNETITGIRIVQIFVRESVNLRRFIEKNVALFSAQKKQLYVYSVFRPLISFLRWVSIGAVIYLGARGIGLNRISYGLLVMFIAYIERFFAPVQHLSEKFDIMQSATAAGEKIISIFKIDAVERKVIEDQSDRFPLIFTGKSKESINRFKGNIVFDDVWFSYKPEEWILQGVSFSVKSMETLAIVGETGAGKSTIINILSKFYEIQRGRVLIDGVNINDIPYWIVRQNIVAVMQDVFLFSRKVSENITLGIPYNKEWFEKISRITHIDSFIERLPGKENEPVMERGVTFSAGERQLLSFARALYYNPSILILDEATSNIDTETEKLIQDAISHLIQGRTSIVIAHRLSTIRNADRIVVLDRGKIVEHGRHQDLMVERGIYHHLYTLQFKTMV